MPRKYRHLVDPKTRAVRGEWEAEGEGGGRRRIRGKADRDGDAKREGREREEVEVEQFYRLRDLWRDACVL